VAQNSIRQSENSSGSGLAGEAGHVWADEPPGALRLGAITACRPLLLRVISLSKTSLQRFPMRILGITLMFLRRKNKLQHRVLR
jgi:hypothetical protein